MSGKKNIYMYAIAAAIVLVVVLLFFIDSMIPAPGRNREIDESFRRYIAFQKLAGAAAAFAGAEGSYPSDVSELVKKGLLDGSIPGILGICADGEDEFAYRGRETGPDMPADLAVMWTRKPAKLRQKDGRKVDVYFSMKNDMTIQMHYGPGYFRAFEKYREKARRVIKLDGEEGVAELRRLIAAGARSEYDAVPVRSACWRAGRLSVAAEELKAALGDAKICFEAARALAAMGDGSGRAVLVERLMSPVPARRKQAHDALVKLGAAVPGYHPYMSFNSRRRMLDKYAGR